MTACTDEVQSNSADPLQGLAVLLVEDNFLNAMALSRALREFGCQVVGPIASLERALSKVRSAEFDVAVLDINILGGCSAPIAEALQALGRPFVFVTGYGSPESLPESLQKAPRLAKPVFPSVLRTTLTSMIARSN